MTYCDAIVTDISDVSQQGAIDAIQDCVSSIRTWMVVNKLKLNEDKTEIILIEAQPQLNKINISRLNIGQASVPVGNSAVRNLGCWFDSNVNMITHINKACQSSFYHLSNIRQTRKHLSPRSTKLLVQAVIMARIDYCNSLLYNIPAIHQSKLQRVQNAATRLITYTSIYDHITPILCSLHWLLVKFCFQYKIAMITFKVIHNLAPAYLSDLVTIKRGSRYNLRSTHYENIREL